MSEFMGMRGSHILLGHGSGGRMSHELIRELFIKAFDHPVLRNETDAAILDWPGSRLAFTTDSFVVDPIFFPGGNIGKLAVCGTVNDLAVSGAMPLYLSASFIIEEGLPLENLKQIVEAMAAEAMKAGVGIVTGDTKVVNRGKCDKIFINTSGIGIIAEGRQDIASGSHIKPGDLVLLNGTLGDHGMAIMAARNELNIEAGIVSDCASLNGLTEAVMKACPGVRFMRDPTRGGLATVLSELTAGKDFGIEIDEEAIAVRPEVGSMCELLGFDPLYVANEGKVVMVIDESQVATALEVMRNHEYGREAVVIGRIRDDHRGKCWMNTSIGGKRILDMMAGEQLPRIC